MHRPPRIQQAAWLSCSPPPGSPCNNIMPAPYRHSTLSWASSEEEDLDLDERPSLCKRKDFLETEEEAKSHPNRTYYYRKSLDCDKLIDICTKKLQVRRY